MTMHQKRYLTTTDITDLLRIDKSTVYRMAEDGRLEGVRVGRQWRFPADQFDDLFAPRSNGWSAALDLVKAEALAGLFAELYDVMVVVTDLDGTPLLPVIHPNAYMDLLQRQPSVVERCTTEWREMASEPALAPRLRPSHLGFICARAYVRSRDRLVAMIVAGGIAPEAWPPPDDRLAAIAADAGLPVDDLRATTGSVTRMDSATKAEMLDALSVLARHLSPDFDTQRSKQ